MLYVPPAPRIAHVQLMGRTGAQRGFLAGGGAVEIIGSTPPDPGPPPPSPPGPYDILGFGASVTGGGATVTHPVNSATSDAWPKLRAGLLSSGARHIKIIGNRDIDAGWDSVVVRNGNLTVEGEEWSGWLRHYLQLTIKDAANILVDRMGLWSGDRNGNVEDSSPLKLNGVQGFAIVHSSLRGGADVTLGILNSSTDGTVQECVLGPPLLASHITSSTNGYGPNVSTPKNGTGYGQRISFIRNFVPYSEARAFRSHGTYGWEVLNCAYYNWGHDCGHANPRAANIIGNLYRKGPETSTPGDRIYRSETNEVTSTYWTSGDNGVYQDDNHGVGFAATFQFASGVELASPWDGGPHNYTPDPADDDLYETIVTAAGRGFDDAVDAAVKAHALAGTSDGYYNGVGFATPNLD